MAEQTEMDARSDVPEDASPVSDQQVETDDTGEMAASPGGTAAAELDLEASIDALVDRVGEISSKKALLILLGVFATGYLIGASRKER